MFRAPAPSPGHTHQSRVSLQQLLCPRRSCPTRGPSKHVISPSDTSGRSLASRIWSSLPACHAHSLTRLPLQSGPLSARPVPRLQGRADGKSGPPGFTAAAPPLGVRESPWEAGLHFPATHEHKHLFLCALVPRISSFIKCRLFKTSVCFC